MHQFVEYHSTVAGTRLKPFDDLIGTDCCYQCEMDSECKGDILEMCEFVNGYKGYDEYTFQMIG